MTKQEARTTIEEWFTAPKDVLEQALEVLIALQGDQWIAKHPELYVHPRETIDERTLGVHQSWDCNLMPYREVRCRGRILYVFEFHINDLLQ